jgi:hypothetical protein
MVKVEKSFKMELNNLETMLKVENYYV